MSDNLVLEHLERIQAQVTQLRETSRELLEIMTSLETHQAAAEKAVLDLREFVASLRAR
jgi:hypothetical protein